jgi:hypothetical protein
MASPRRAPPGKLIQLGEDLIQRCGVEHAKPLQAVDLIDGRQLEHQGDRRQGQAVLPIRENRQRAGKA